MHVNKYSHNNQKANNVNDIPSLPTWLHPFLRLSKHKNIALLAQVIMTPSSEHHQIPNSMCFLFHPLNGFETMKFSKAFNKYFKWLLCINPDWEWIENGKFFIFTSKHQIVQIVFQKKMHSSIVCFSVSNSNFNLLHILIEIWDVLHVTSQKYKIKIKEKEIY
jgi:hypothetical protein